MLIFMPRQKSFATKMPSVQTMLRMTYMPPEMPMPAMSAPSRINGANMRLVDTATCSGTPTSEGTAG